MLAMEEGSQMSMNAFVKACEAYEANILMLKEKISDLERKLAEQDMKIQAPIRNDNAFLLKLAAIRKYENVQSGEFRKSKLSSRKLIWPEIITSDRYDHAFVATGCGILFIHSKLFSYCSDPREILCNIVYVDVCGPRIAEILIKCLSKSKMYSGYVSLSDIDPLRDDDDYDRDEEDYPVRKAHLAVHLDSSGRLYLCLAISMNTPATEKLVLIELDDLSNKDYIEKNFNVENLLE